MRRLLAGHAGATTAPGPLPRPAHGPPNGRGDQGVAFLVAVIAVALVMAVIAGMVFSSAVDNIDTSARSVQRGQAIQAARAGLDATYQKISTSVTKDLPCGTDAVTGTLGSAPSTSRYAVTLTFYAQLTGRTSLACTLLRSGTTPESVVLASTGTDLGQSAKMLSLSNLALGTTGLTSLFADAVFVNGSLLITGTVTFRFTGSKGMYINGTLTCSGTANETGNVVVVGKLTALGTCQLNSAVTVIGTVVFSGGHPTIGGVLRSTDGSIKVTAKPYIPETIFAKHSVTYNSSRWKTTLHGTIHANTSSLTTPPSQSLPTVPWRPSTWQKTGYTTFTYNTCKATGAVTTALYATIASMSTATKPLAIYTKCAVTGFPRGTYALNRSLALFAAGGFNISGNVHFVAKGTARPALYLVVPTKRYTTSTSSTGSSVSCATGNGDVVLSGGASITTNVDTLAFTPCSVSVTGNSYIAEGAVYAGTSFKPAGTMNYGTALTVPGSSGATASPSPPVVGIVYERLAS